MEHFFSTLGVEQLSTIILKTLLNQVKKFAGAEFCAPMDAFFGHVQNLADKCDYIFLPVYLEAAQPKEDAYRYYCYYTHLRQRWQQELKAYIWKRERSCP